MNEHPFFQTNFIENKSPSSESNISSFNQTFFLLYELILFRLNKETAFSETNIFLPYKQTSLFPTLHLTHLPRIEKDWAHKLPHMLQKSLWWHLTYWLCSDMNSRMSYHDRRHCNLRPITYTSSLPHHDTSVMQMWQDYLTWVLLFVHITQPESNSYYGNLQLPGWTK